MNNKQPDNAAPLSFNPAGFSVATQRASFYETVESIIGGSLAMLIAFEIIVLTVLMVIDPPSGNLHVAKPISIPLLAICVIMDGFVIIKSWRCIADRRFPLALEMVEMHPRLPWLLRPLATLMWMVHGVTLFWTAFAMHVAIDRGWHYGQEYLVGAVLTLLVFGMTFTANIYAVLAIGSVNPESVWIERFWRFRIWIDLGLAVMAWVLPMLRRG